MKSKENKGSIRRRRGIKEKNTNKRRTGEDKRNKGNTRITREVKEKKGNTRRPSVDKAKDKENRRR